MNVPHWLGGYGYTEQESQLPVDAGGHYAQPQPWPAYYVHASGHRIHPPPMPPAQWAAPLDPHGAATHGHRAHPLAYNSSVPAEHGHGVYYGVPMPAAHPAPDVGDAVEEHPWADAAAAASDDGDCDGDRAEPGHGVVHATVQPPASPRRRSSRPTRRPRVRYDLSPSASPPPPPRKRTKAGTKKKAGGSGGTSSTSARAPPAPRARGRAFSSVSDPGVAAGAGSASHSGGLQLLRAGPGPIIHTDAGVFWLLNAQANLLDPPPGATLDGSDLLIIHPPGTHPAETGAMTGLGGEPDAGASSTYEVYTCRACYKAYDGKNARSVARRHLQDKHGVKLEWQKRRTRWEQAPPKPASHVHAQHEKAKACKREYAQRTRTQARIERDHASYLESFGPSGLKTSAGITLVAPRYKLHAAPSMTASVSSAPSSSSSASAASTPVASQRPPHGFLDGHAPDLVLPSDLRAEIAALRQLVRAENREHDKSLSPLPTVPEEMDIADAAEVDWPRSYEGARMGPGGPATPASELDAAYEVDDNVESADTTLAGESPALPAGQDMPIGGSSVYHWGSALPAVSYGATREHALQPAAEVVSSARTPRRATISGAPSFKMHQWRSLPRLEPTAGYRPADGDSGSDWGGSKADDAGAVVEVAPTIEHVVPGPRVDADWATDEQFADALDGLAAEQHQWSFASLSWTTPSFVLSHAEAGIADADYRAGVRAQRGTASSSYPAPSTAYEEDEQAAAEAAKELLNLATSPVKPDDDAHPSSFTATSLSRSGRSSTTTLARSRATPHHASSSPTNVGRSLGWDTAASSLARATPYHLHRTPARARPAAFVAHRPDAPHRSLSSYEDPFLLSPAAALATPYGAKEKRAWPSRKRRATDAGRDDRQPKRGEGDASVGREPPSSPFRLPLGVLRANATGHRAHVAETPRPRGRGGDEDDVSQWLLSSPAGDVAASLGLAPPALLATPGIRAIIGHDTPVSKPSRA